MTSNPTLRRIVAALAFAGIVAGGTRFVAGETAGLPWLGDATAAQSATVQKPSLALPDFASVAARNGPAVVNVSVTGLARGPAPGEDDSGVPPFLQRFGPQARIPVQGVGSGFIVSADGLILTNAHVVDGAREVTVRLTDRREFSAKVLGADAQSDVAVLRIEASGLPVVQTGDSREVRVGDWVLAIGSPFGLDNTVTAGIISAKSRALPSDTYVPFLQTDVAINPGNSGGPLFDTAGNVIGINSQIFSRSGGYQGLSFAIPIEVAMQVKDEILEHGRVRRGWLGVTIQDVTQGLADSFGLARPQGAIISGVAPGSPAERAGLKTGDVLLGIGGEPVSGSADIPARVSRLHPGETLALHLWRKGSERDVSAVLAEPPGQPAPVATRATPSGEDARLGLAVRPLTPGEHGESGIRGGLVVEQVDGAAARAGIQPGDVVLALNGTPVSSVEELRAAIGHAGRHVALLIQREDARIFVPVALG